MFEDLFKKLGISQEEFNTVIAVLGIVLTLVLAVIGPVRRFLVWGFYAALNTLGFTGWVYRKRFLNRYGQVHNIYLDRTETLDLRATYIPLHINRPEHTGRIPAVEILSDPHERRLIIVGDPGTGKTTLIKAFGTGILRPFAGLRAHEAILVRRVRETPIIVDLRHFAGKTYEQFSLVRYITDHVLRDEMKIKHGDAFLNRLLRTERCLVLLDGLDEVGEDEYESVRARIGEFCSGPVPGFETEKARIVMTCRRQNFDRIQTDWIPLPFREVVTLVPFDTGEVYAFLERRLPDFREGRTPKKFFEQIQRSGLADMHRNPLVLTISLGLYLNTPKYEIPGSIAKFYEAMILELLRRHDFRTRPHIKSVNHYNSEDKFRFLREFALEMAIRDRGFDEFTYREIKDFFGKVYEKMTNVGLQDADKFIHEIIYHAGLLARVSDDGIYIFAHRSIHEYFAAAQLARTPVEGARALLERANNLRWRQVIVFFGSLDHEQVEPFLTQLMQRNLELAGHCIPAAQVVSSPLTDRLADALVQDIRAGNAPIALPALVSMTHSQHHHIRNTALTRLQTVIGDLLHTQTYQLSGLRDEDRKELLTQLAITSSIDIVPACLQLSELISNPTDSIESLWHCLTIAGIEEKQALCRRIVRRLLDAVMTPEGLVELQRQPAFTPDFATDELRAKVYPFRNCHESNSNFVTLLAWADRMTATPTVLNVFFAGKQDNHDAWRRAERDRSRFTLRIHWHPIGLSASIIAHVLSFVYLPTILFSRGWDALLLPGESIWWFALYCGIAILATFFSFVFLVARDESAFRISSEGLSGSSHFLFWLHNRFPQVPMMNFAVFLAILFLAPSLLVVFWRTLFIHLPFAVQLLLAIVLSLLFYWLPLCDGCRQGEMTYLRKPNPLIGIYDDDRSRHWIERVG